MIPIPFEKIAALKPLFADPKSNEQQLLKKYTDNRSRFVSINGSLIHYREEGTGQPLILIHGAFSSLHTFRKMDESSFQKIQSNFIRFTWVWTDRSNF